MLAILKGGMEFPPFKGSHKQFCPVLKAGGGGGGGVQKVSDP